MVNAFVLPASLDLDLSDGKFNLRHEGDVTLEQTFGLEIGVIDVQGNLELKLDRVGGRIRCGGHLRVHGTVDADTLHARDIVFDSAHITARAIAADERILIGHATLKVDIIIAPTIEIDPKSSGRVTVIESHNELAPTRVRGGYSLAEYQEDFGDVEAFLADRGVTRLGLTVNTSIPIPDDVVVSDDDGLQTEPPYEADPTEEAPPTQSDEANEPDELPATPEPTAEELVDDPLSLTGEDLIPVPDEADPLHDKLAEAMERIVACYSEELPPPVERLRDLIDARDHEALRAAITEVWTGLLGYHQQRGIRPHHQVTHAFNVIHGLVTEA
jgi:hypothetical protein